MRKTDNASQKIQAEYKKLYLMHLVYKRMVAYYIFTSYSLSQLAFTLNF